jgi:hypothetical protein
VTRYFFATADDLLPIFSRVEAKREVVYTLTGLLKSRPVDSFTRGVELPTLRRAPDCRSTVCCPAYLVTPAGAKVRVREVPQAAGGVMYAVDQLHNPDSIELNHGGRPQPGVLLAGRVATCTGTEASTGLFRAYANAIARTFTRIQAFWLGPEAQGLLAAGCRLTDSADSPPEYDLAPSDGGGSTEKPATAESERIRRLTCQKSDQWARNPVGTADIARVPLKNRPQLGDS